MSSITRPPSNSHRFWNALLTLPLGLLAVLAPAPSTTAEQPAHLRSDGHVNLVWLHAGSSETYRAQVEAANGVTVVAPTWWYLDRDDLGGLDDSGDAAFAAWARERGLAVWPLLGNRVDPDLSDAVLRDPALRARLVTSTVAAVERVGAQGVNVDFENLHDRSAELLTVFVSELKAALPDLVVSVDVPAMTDTWVVDNGRAFDRPGLGRVADYVVLMAYDQHNSRRPGGPVAGLHWVRHSIEYLLRNAVPAEKVLLGLPLYSRDWVDRHGEVSLEDTLGMAAMQRRLVQRDAVPTDDEDAGQRLWRYVDASGHTHRVWQEDAASLTAKAQLVGEHGLAGTAAWRAGFETPEVWEAIDTVLAAVPAPGSGRTSGAPRIQMPAAPPAPQAAGPQHATATGREAAAEASTPRPLSVRSGEVSLTFALLLAVAVAHVLRRRRRLP